MCETARESFILPRKPVISSKVQNDTQLFRRKTGCRRARTFILIISTMQCARRKVSSPLRREKKKAEIAQRGSGGVSEKVGKNYYPPGRVACERGIYKPCRESQFPDALTVTSFSIIIGSMNGRHGSHRNAIPPSRVYAAAARISRVSGGCATAHHWGARHLNLIPGCVWSLASPAACVYSRGASRPCVPRLSACATAPKSIHARATTNEASDGSRHFRRGWRYAREGKTFRTCPPATFYSAGGGGGCARVHVRALHVARGSRFRDAR